ncbi:MAG TPA: CHAT domain-containing tetratricopeptide repeat protein [Pyrinomonadaceae bacterium]
MKAIRCLRTTILTRLILFSVLCLPFVLAHVASSQTSEGVSVDPAPESIELNASVRRELGVGEIHLYKLALTEGSFADLSLIQDGVEVVVGITDPAGKPVIEFEAPKSKGATQPIAFVAETSGVHVLSIRHRTKDAQAGQYEIKWGVLRSSTAADRASFESMRLFLEARTLNLGGKYDEAFAKAQGSLQAADAVGAHTDERKAEILNLVADIYSNKGEYLKAREYFNLSLAAYEKMHGPESHFVAVILNNLARNHRITNEFDTAEKMYLRALAIDEKYFGPEHTEIAELLNNLGFLYYTMGEYSRVEPIYQRSLAIREKAAGQDSMDVATVTNNLALLHRARGDYPKAIEYLQRSLANARKNLAEGHPTIALMSSNLGAVSTEMGDFEQAESYFNESLAIREKRLGPEHPDLANTLNNLGSLHEQRGDLERAEAYYKRALAIRQKAFAADHAMVGQSLGNLGLFYSQKGDHAKAEPLLVRALDIYEKKLGKEHQSVAGALANLGLLYLNTGRYDLAEPLLQRSLQIYESSVGATHPVTARPISTLARLYAAKNDSTKALAYQERYLAIRNHNLDLNLFTGSERQKLAYTATLADDIDSMVSMHATLSPRDPKAKEMAFSLILNRKGRTLDAIAAANSALRRRSDPIDVKLLDQLSDLRTRLAVLTLRGLASDSPEEYRKKLRSLEDSREKLEDEISRRSGLLVSKGEPLSSAAVRPLIPENAALVEFVAYTPQNLAAKPEDPSVARYGVYVLRRTGDIEWKDLGDAPAIDAAAAKLRAALRDPGRKDVRQLGRELDSKLLAPVRAMVGDADHLLISPDGELNLLAFDALVDGQDRYLPENYLVTYLTSGRDLARRTVERQTTTPIIFADPDFGVPTDPIAASATRVAAKRQSITVTRDLTGTYFAPLRGTAAEADAIKRLMPEATVLTAMKASEQELKSVAAPRILHIATHGFFLADPEVKRSGSKPDPTAFTVSPLLRGGLAFVGANTRRSDPEDGLLTGLEASGLDLLGTKLVVLSACDTGVGEVRIGEGVFGLRRSFTLAGAEALVMSLWPVSDQVTRELMVSYYRNLGQGLGRGEALRQAKLAMLRRPARRHPFYWASFIQAGNWTPIRSN